jgi:hypothetical protein
MPLLEFGFPCMTVGLLIGSVLVQETALGAAYFLDPKGYRLLRDVVGLRLAPFRAPIRRAARPQGGLSFRRRLVVMMAVWAANLVSHVHRFGAP